MPIRVQCPACRKKYLVRDNLAGVKVSCEKCQGVIRVPASEVDDEDIEESVAEEYEEKPLARSKRKDSSGVSNRGATNRTVARPSRKKRAFPRQTAIGIAAVIVVIGLGYYLVKLGRANINLAATNANVAQPADGSLPSYSAAQLKEQQKIVAMTFRPEAWATVIITGTADDPGKFLYHRIFQAAEVEYETTVRAAIEQTERNRKEAESRAIAEAQHRIGLVEYKYQRVDPGIRSPYIQGGKSGKNQYTYYVGPVLNMQVFADRCRIGKASFNGRTITIASTLSDPIVDIYVEDFRLKYGVENVVMLEVANATGDPARIGAFIRAKISNLESPGKPYEVLDVRKNPSKEDEYVVCLLNVKDVAEFAKRQGLGGVLVSDQGKKLIRIQSQLPYEETRSLTPREVEAIALEASLKAQEELEARRQKNEEERREQMMVADAERKRKEGDLNPADGEEEIDWAIRVLSKIDQRSEVISKALNWISYNPVVEERRPEVETILLRLMKGNTLFHYRGHIISAVDQWYSEKFLSDLSRMIAEEHARGPVDIFQILVKHPSDKAARAVAQKIGDFFVATAAAQSLREMGAVAEDAVLAYVDDQNLKVRTEAYTILADIGTKKSMVKLAGNMNKERDKAIKEGLKNVIAQIRDRLKEEKPADDKPK